VPLWTQILRNTAGGRALPSFKLNCSRKDTKPPPLGEFGTATVFAPNSSANVYLSLRGTFDKEYAR